VVELLAAHVTAGAPRRDDDARHPEAGSDRLAIDVLVVHARWRDRRDDVVEQPVVLVVVEDENGRGPYAGVARERRDDRGDERGALGR
jgi:hypothetical protein